ncbi:MAG: hypothetical protein JW854_15775 [Actinobacteria bacterium]|nr:hypothetical protein [Actinomycetota bacterium]
MRIRTTSHKAAAAGVLAFSFLLLAVAVGCGGGEQGSEEAAGDLSMEEMWTRAQEADSNIEAWHMEIASYYENTQYGSGQIQSIIIDVNGEDIHEQDLLLGQVYFEYKRVGDKQYNKDMENGTWSEVPADQDSSSATGYTSQFLELPSMAASQKHVGTETIDEEEAEHFRFTLTPEGVSQMFSTQPSFDFGENTGGEVDVWIDSDEYYLLRYELVIRGAIIPEQIGKGDIRFVVSIRDINEPIEITPPI